MPCRGRFAFVGIKSSGKHSVLKAAIEENLIEPIEIPAASEFELILIIYACFVFFFLVVLFRPLEKGRKIAISWTR